MTVHTALTDAQLIERAKRQGLRIACLSKYCHDKSNLDEPIIIINYSGLNSHHLPEAVARLSAIL